MSRRKADAGWSRSLPDGGARTGLKPRRQAARDKSRPRPRDHGHETPLLLYGWHTVVAALENPSRRITRLLVTENALRRLAADGVPLPVEPELVRPDAIANRLGPDAVHQGLLAEAEPLAISKTFPPRVSFWCWTTSLTRIMPGRSYAPLRLLRYAR